MKIFLRKKDGYILTWVLCFFLIVSIVSVTTMSFAVMSTQSTVIQHNVRQAQFTAKSAVTAVAKHIMKNASNATELAKLMAVPGTGSIPEMGDYRVSVSYDVNNNIKVSATAQYKGQSATTSAVLAFSPGRGGLLPTNHVMYVNEPKNGASKFNQSKFNGHVFINGAFDLSEGSSINGQVVVNGDVKMSGYASSTLNLYSFGNVTYAASGNLTGNLYAKKNLFFSGSGRVYGDVHAEGSLDMSGGRIDGDVRIGGTANFSGGGDKIGKDLYYYGSQPTIPYGSLDTFVRDGTNPLYVGIPLSEFPEIDMSDYLAPTLPAVVPPSFNNYIPRVTNSNMIISTSGKMSISTFNQLSGKAYYNITIDATSDDISLVVDSEEFYTPKNLSLKIIGENNVYLYLTNKATLTLADNQYFGNTQQGSAPQLYILGDDTQTGITLVSSSSLNACVYMPKGKINVSGSGYGGEKFSGVCIVADADVNSNNTFSYNPPSGLNGSPLGDFVMGEWKTSSAWAIRNWGE